MVYWHFGLGYIIQSEKIPVPMQNLKPKIEKSIDIANNFFTVPGAYIASHINDDGYVVKKEDSKNRIIWLSVIFGILLSLGLCFIISLVISISSVKYENCL